MPDPIPQSIPPNAFHPAYLQALSARLDSEPAGAHEADLDGPWTVHPVPDPAHPTRERWGVYRPGETAGGPYLLFEDPFTAYLAAAVLPGTGRPDLYRPGGADPAQPGYRDSVRLEEVQGDRVGWSRYAAERLCEALHVTACITRAPRSLALLLLAAGPSTLERVGAILAELLDTTPALGDDRDGDGR